jgi:hypothetical protein
MQAGPEIFDSFPSQHVPRLDDHRVDFTAFTGFLAQKNFSNVTVPFAWFSILSPKYVHVSVRSKWAAGKAVRAGLAPRGRVS